MPFTFFVPLVISVELITFTYCRILRKKADPPGPAGRLLSLRRFLRAMDKLDQPDRRSVADFPLPCFSANISGGIFQRIRARVK
jgi:hypothetical protein